MKPYREACGCLVVDEDKLIVLLEPCPKHIEPEYLDETIPPEYFIVPPPEAIRKMRRYAAKVRDDVQEATCVD